MSQRRADFSRRDVRSRDEGLKFEGRKLLVLDQRSQRGSRPYRQREVRSRVHPQTRGCAQFQPSRAECKDIDNESRRLVRSAATIVRV